MVFRFPLPVLIIVASVALFAGHPSINVAQDPTQQDAIEEHSGETHDRDPHDGDVDGSRGLDVTASHGEFPWLFRPQQTSLLTESLPGPAWQRFVELHPSDAEWQLLFNWNTRTPHRIFGPKGFSRGPIRDAQHLDSRARQLIEQHRDLLRLGEQSLRLHNARKVSRLWVAIYECQWDGVPIRGSRVEVRLFEDGSLVMLGADTFAENVELPGTTGRTRQQIAAAVADWEFLEDAPIEIQEVFYGIPSTRGFEPRRGWELTSGDWQLFLTDVEVVDAKPRVDYLRSLRFGANVIGSAEGLASGSGLPDTAGNPPIPQPLSSLEFLVDGTPFTTDAVGDFDVTLPGAGPHSVTATLAGPWVVVQDATGNNLTFSGTFFDGVNQSIDFNVSPSELTTAQVNAFVEVNRVHDYLKQIDPNFTLMDFPILATVNLSALQCNAIYSAGSNSLSFYQSGGGCVNSSFAPVIHHEYGHGVTDFIYTGGFPSGGYAEGIADVCAFLLNDNPELGTDFFGPGTFVRHVANQDRSYPQDVNNEVHDAGLIVGGAYWDMRVALGTSLGDPAALQRARELFLASQQLQPPVISPDIGLDVLMVDDNDGDLTNLTPNYFAIQQGMSAHGIAAPDLSISVDVVSADDIIDTSQPVFVEAEAISIVGSIDSVTLFYSDDEMQSFTPIPMVNVGSDLYRADLGFLSAPQVAHYRVEATNTGGGTAFSPASGVADDVHVLRIGFATPILETSFEEGDDAGWTHIQIAGQDDWQRGFPNADFGNANDPFGPFSGANAWANDLGEANFNGDYQPNVENRLDSPAIDAGNLSGLRLRFRRWLTVEDGTFDQASILANGSAIWQNPVGGGQDHLLDRSWKLHDLDLSMLDQQGSAQVSFHLQSDGGLQFGGWTIDDLEIYTLSASTVAPTLSSITPATGPYAGGNTVELAGTGFSTNITSFAVGGVELLTVDVQNATSAFASLPPSTLAGPQDVIAFNGSESSAPLVGAYSYGGAPTVTLVLPSGASPLGGTLCTATGSDLASNSTITVGGVAVAVTFVDLQTLQFTSPPLPPGVTDVVVSNANGSATVTGALLIASPPIVDSLQPDSGPTTGGTVVDIAGSEFTPTDAVSIDGVMVVSEFVTPGLRRVTTPAHAAGNVEVVVTNVNGSSSSSFSYFAGPVIASITPSSGSELGGDVLTFVGNNFAPDTTVMFGTTPAAAVNIVSDSEMQVTTPTLPPGFVDVTATNSSGSTTLASAFEALPMQFMRGDVTDDGNIGLPDAIAVLSYLFVGAAEPNCLDTADATDDGNLGLPDALLILNYLFTGGTAPAAPFPNCGADPTPDTVSCLQSSC